MRSFMCYEMLIVNSSALGQSPFRCVFPLGRYLFLRRSYAFLAVNNGYLSYCSCQLLCQRIFHEKIVLKIIMGQTLRAIASFKLALPMEMLPRS